MKVIGITGGVGAGKSEVLGIIRQMTDCVIILADDLARSLEKKGEVCYEPLIELLGKDVCGDDGEIDSKRMAAAIFKKGDKEKLAAVNAIVHPAVKKRILELIDKERKRGEIPYFFIEAALLIEDGYDLIVDEMWYIFATKQERAKRLAQSRGYSQEKIEEIMGNQSSEETFRKYCKVVIDNSGDLEETKEQLKKILGRGTNCDTEE